MRRVFSAGSGFVVADGTRVLPLLELLDEGGGTTISLALGEVGPGVTSRIHVHPIVAQVTLVLAGTITATMKDASEPAPYTLEVGESSAVLTPPGTLLQLANPTARLARVLYVVTPAWVGDAEYDDAVVLEGDFADLERSGWHVPELADLAAVRARRAACLARVRAG